MNARTNAPQLSRTPVLLDRPVSPAQSDSRLPDNLAQLANPTDPRFANLVEFRLADATPMIGSWPGDRNDSLWPAVQSFKSVAEAVSLTLHDNESAPVGPQQRANANAAIALKHTKAAEDAASAVLEFQSNLSRQLTDSSPTPPWESLTYADVTLHVELSRRLREVPATERGSGLGTASAEVRIT